MDFIKWFYLFHTSNSIKFRLQILPPPKIFYNFKITKLKSETLDCSCQQIGPTSYDKCLQVLPIPIQLNWRKDWNQIWSLCSLNAECSCSLMFQCYCFNSWCQTQTLVGTSGEMCPMSNVVHRDWPEFQLRIIRSILETSLPSLLI